MKLIITSSIRKAEFEPIQDVFDLKVIKIAAKKALQGLGVKIKSSSKISGTLLRKVYLTSSSGAGRVVFLLKISNKTSVLVMVRAKNDKQIGANMTIKNKKFKNVLDKNLDVILKNLEEGSYEGFEL